MDSELKEHFDRLERHFDTRFGESQAQLADFRRDVEHRFEQVDDKIRQVDDRVSQVNDRVRQVDDRVSQVNDRVRQVNDRVSQVDDKIRHTHVVVEDVRGLVQTVAEGLVAVRETQKQTTETLRGEIGEVRDLLTASYRYLDRRLATPEGHA